MNCREARKAQADGGVRFLSKPSLTFRLSNSLALTFILHVIPDSIANFTV